MKKGGGTLKVLVQIRDAVRQMGACIDQTNARIDQTNARLEHMGTDLRGAIAETNSRLDETNLRLDALTQHVIKSDLRWGTAIAALTAEVGGVKSEVRDVKLILRDHHDLPARMDRCEHDIADLKRRTAPK